MDFISRKYSNIRYFYPVFITLQSKNEQMQHVDIVIAGQGLAGTMLAWELWEQDIPFRIFDPGEGNHSSMAAAGMFSLLAARRLKEMDLAGQQYEVMKETLNKIENKIGRQFLFEIPTARLIDKEEIPLWETASKGDIAHLVKKLEPEFPAEGIVPGFGAAIIEPSGYIDIPGLLISMREWLIVSKNLMLEKLDYGEFKPIDDGFIINGHTYARKVVFCDGPSITKNPWFRYSDIRQNKGEWIEIEASGLSPEYIYKREIFILPLGNACFRVGATFSHDEMDPNPTMAARKELEQKLGSIISVPYRITGHRAGIRPSSRNRLPVAEPHRDIPGLYIFNGLGSRGVLQAPWYARTLAEKIGSENIKTEKHRSQIR